MFLLLPRDMRRVYEVFLSLLIFVICTASGPPLPLFLRELGVTLTLTLGLALD